MNEPHVDAIFGPLRAEADGYWGTTAQVGDATVELDMTIDDAIDVAAITRLTAHLRDLPTLEARARAALREEVEHDGSAVLQLRDRLGGQLSAAQRADAALLIAALQLQRIGLYPDEDELAIVVDFAIGGAISSSGPLLSVILDRDGDAVAVNLDC